MCSTTCSQNNRNLTNELAGSAWTYCSAKPAMFANASQLGFRNSKLTVFMTFPVRSNRCAKSTNYFSSCFRLSADRRKGAIQPRLNCNKPMLIPHLPFWRSRTWTRQHWKHRVVQPYVFGFLPQGPVLCHTEIPGLVRGSR